MKKTEHQITEQVYAAKTDTAAADALIRQYMNFIRSEMAKTVRRANNGLEDEESIAMFAFYEAILSYEKEEERFCHMRHGRSETGLLIIFGKSENTEISFLLTNHLPGKKRRSVGWICWRIKATHMESICTERPARRRYRNLKKKLAEFDLSFGEVADNCPRQKRTFRACMQVLNSAPKKAGAAGEAAAEPKAADGRTGGGIRHGQKDYGKASKVSGSDSSAYTNGYEIIRGHLCQLEPGREEKAV